MRCVKLNEVYISNVMEFLEFVKGTLDGCKDTQVFISEKLFARLLEENKSNVIWEEDVLGSFHYCDKVEHAFIFCFKVCNEDETYQMHFVRNSTDYLQLTNFLCKDVVYRHYLCGMKVVLVFSSDH